MTKKWVFTGQCQVKSKINFRATLLLVTELTPNYATLDKSKKDKPTSHESSFKDS